jgi:adenosine deaminase
MSQEQAIRAALKGLKRSDLACNLILCCMRGNDTKESNLKTVKLASKYLVEDEGVVALDLAGAEGLFPTADYEEEFHLAKKLGVPFTIHAGEADGSSSIKKALEFGAARIGHGVRAYEDPELLERLVREKICLELCPTSNRQTKAVQNMDQYPLRSFIEAGICVTINTDDMAISRTDIQHEFAYIRNKFRISEEEEKILLINAVKSAFTSNNRKEKLLRQIQE